MEGFCRGCLTSYDDPMELLLYTEKRRRLFLYSTGIQVKRNDLITFQLCKNCAVSMKAASNFKKMCRASDKKLNSYLSLKDAGISIDFGTFLKNSEDSTLFRLPLASGSSTPANYNKTKEDDNESTCTSIRNFMKDILQGEEMADTEARIIREVIEEEADLLDDTLDSNWLHDENSIDNDFPLDLNFSPFATPYSVNNDHCYTPKREDQTQVKKYFTSISPLKHHGTMNIITDIIKNNQSEKEICFSNISDPNHEQTIINLNVCNADNQKTTDDVNLPTNRTGKEIVDLNLPLIEEEKFMLDVSIDNEKILTNLNLPIEYEIDTNNAELQSFDSLPSIPSINESMSNLDLPVMENASKDVINTANFYVSNDATDYINTCNEIEKLVDGKLNSKKNNKEKPCPIDKNLARALKDENATEYSLDELLISPQVPSVASTPTITDILFGEKVNSGKINFSEKSEILGKDVQDYEIIEDFFQNDTKAFKPEIKDLKEKFEETIKENIVIKEITKIDSSSEYEQSQFDFENCFCNICEKKYQSIKALCIHSAKKHNIKIINHDKAYISRPRVCQFCGVVFKNLQNYHRHLKKHKKAEKITEAKTHKCDHCTLEFSSIYTLQRHKASLDPSSKPKLNPPKFVCTICGATSRTKGNFRLHQRRHGKEYKCQCEECGKKFYTQSELTVHIRNHTGEKPFPCTYCDRKFSRKDALIKHVKLHLDERLFPCEYCNTRFTTSSQLKVHIRKSIKCKRKRGIVDAASPMEFEKEDTIEGNIETDEVHEVVFQLPYIDTELSN